MEYLSETTKTMKRVETWTSSRLQCETTLVRWGHFGVPFLIFPTAGGDAEEIERFFLIKVLEPYIHEGRIKVYSVDSINGRTWLTEDDIAKCVWTQKQYDEYLMQEVVPAIRMDCQSDSIEMLIGGASIGALNALTFGCRYPEVFSASLCLSGTYDIDKWLGGKWFDDFGRYTPLHYVPKHASAEAIEKLKQRFFLIATGKGKNEDPEESWKVANMLGAHGIPNRVDCWDEEWEHDWVTWREMLPKYTEEMLERNS